MPNPAAGVPQGRPSSQPLPAGAARKIARLSRGSPWTEVYSRTSARETALLWAWAWVRNRAHLSEADLQEPAGCRILPVVFDPDDMFMSQADTIREFVIRRFAAPARAAGRPGFAIRAGDVHAAIGLRNALPNVCSAIGSMKFQEEAGVRLVRREGPHAGSNAVFEFAFVDPPSSGPRTAASVPPPRKGEERERHVENEDILLLDRRMRVPPDASPDFRDAVVLVACVKSKRTAAAPARDLYVSQGFRDARAIVEAQGARWFILSALYGLVEPERLIGPYEYTLNTLGVAERKAWAKRVLAVLLPSLPPRCRVVFFAGARYREFLEAPLRAAGHPVEVPMEGLRQGEQRAWLARHR